MPHPNYQTQQGFGGKNTHQDETVPSTNNQVKTLPAPPAVMPKARPQATHHSTIHALYAVWNEDGSARHPRSQATHPVCG